MGKNAIQLVSFNKIDFDDRFFDSLRDDYSEFMDWVEQKVKKGEKAYVLRNERGLVEGFLYLKEEKSTSIDILPHLPEGKHIKIGTFKINAHNTVLGQRFLSLAFNKLVETGSKYIYATMFDKQSGLINLFSKFGFIEWGINERSEKVLYKDLIFQGNFYKDFPLVDCCNCNKYLLSIYPKYHLLMFPDSKLYTERNEGDKDLSVTNTIEKVYMCNMKGIRFISPGDIIIIYRTSDAGEIAEYKSVATSVCTVVEIKNISEFSGFSEFTDYCQRGTVFKIGELKSFFLNKKYPYIIKLLYNAHFQKRVIRRELIETVGLKRNQYFGCVHLSEEQFRKIIKLGEINENIIVN